MCRSRLRRGSSSASQARATAGTDTVRAECRFTASQTLAFEESSTTDRITPHHGRGDQMRKGSMRQVDKDLLHSKVGRTRSLSPRRPAVDIKNTQTGTRGEAMQDAHVLLRAQMAPAEEHLSQWRLRRFAFLSKELMPCRNALHRAPLSPRHVIQMHKERLPMSVHGTH